ncbi:class I SAM-dependent methyltransferase [bacterium]|nr:class I SAM-dependent methyltransferase [bacterium]
MISPFYLSIGKSALYFTESLPLIVLSQLYANKDTAKPPQLSELKALAKEIYSLHKMDTENIKNDIYPAAVIPLNSPLTHTKKLIKVWADALLVAQRMKTKKHKDFSTEAQSYLESVPDYYSRNFHFQTDGYLSEDSAKIYDHQVEILFNGTAQTMRRLAIPPLRKIFSRDSQCEILDLACGPGSLTKDLSLTFPQARITAVDMSFPYLKEAQKRLRRFSKINFLQANAENLPFKDQQFDAVTCSYLFHELPQKTRRIVLQEALRVLKPGGVLSVVDSIQANEAPHLEWAVQSFPVSYHEPFYKNYLNNPLEDELKKITSAPILSQRGFFSKSVSLQNEIAN